MNKCKVYTFRKNKWIELDNFEIREWQMRRDEGEIPFKGFVTQDNNGVFYVDTFDCRKGEVIQRKLKINIHIKDMFINSKSW